MSCEESPATVDKRWLCHFRAALVEWYNEHHRRLPWRETRDPYPIWVSEVMLQQTQVATVLGYYDRFLAAFPDIRALAKAPEEDVLRLWSGLGYYRRARQLHSAAKVICDRHDGVFPKTLEQIHELPGVGRYTAGAIASFAFDLPAPILEANTARLFSRLLLIRQDLKLSSVQTQLWDFAERSVVDLSPVEPVLNAGRSSRAEEQKRAGASRKSTSRRTDKAQRSKTVSLGPGRVNQALMELGSQVCTPRTPKCLCCPVQSLCPTFKHGFQDEIPIASVKPMTVRKNHALVIVRRRGRFLLRQNQADQWWAGLWDFPRIETSSKLPPGKSGPVWQARERAGNAGISVAAQKKIKSDLWGLLQLECSLLDWVYFLRHAVTKYQISLYCFDADMDSEQAKKVGRRNGWRWASMEELSDSLPLTSTAKRLSKWLQSED